MRNSVVIEGTGDINEAIIRAERIRDEVAAREAVAPPKVVQLQIKFHKDAPPAPNDLLRSAFFPAIQSKDRKFINNEIIASIDGIAIKMKGEQLNQDDLDTFLVTQIISQGQPATLQGRSTERGLLKMLGRRKGNNTVKALWDSIVRIKSATIILEGNGIKYAGSLIDDVFRDDVTREYVWRFNPRLNALLNAGSTFISLETRKKLGGKPLSQWLQAKYASHTRPYSYNVSTLQKLSGCRTSELKEFRRMLRNALDHLKEIGEIVNWSIDASDKVHIIKATRIQG